MSSCTESGESQSLRRKLYKAAKSESKVQHKKKEGKALFRYVVTLYLCSLRFCNVQAFDHKANFVSHKLQWHSGWHYIDFKIFCYFIALDKWIERIDIQRGNRELLSTFVPVWKVSITESPSTSMPPKTIPD